MSEVKIIYGSSTGDTKKAAELIAQELQGVAMDAAAANAEDFNAEVLILGTSTWGIGELQEDWIEKLEMLEALDWRKRKIALFGMGDQVGFSDSYIDGVRILYDLLEKRGACLFGKWSCSGYRHNFSAAEIDGSFIGLALDENNEPEKTGNRIKEWCACLRIEAEL